MSNGTIKEITRNIRKDVERELWTKAAGRCQFNGCNRPLYKSPITQESVNISEKAHIYSFSENGPRGWGPFRSNPKNLNSVENLMLLCHDCHKTIDHDQHGVKYSAALLQYWKKEHESRISMVTGIIPNKKSHVVFYSSNIGKQKSRIQHEDAMFAMFPERFPVADLPNILSMDCSHEDKSPSFWATESAHLEKIFINKILPLIENSTVKHFSLFSFADMPLLIKLGTLFTDKIDVDVYQPIREPYGWNWQEFPDGFRFIINEPEEKVGSPVLVISLSDHISFERITSVLGDDISIWELTVPDNYIGNDNIRSKAQLSMMRSVIRELMVQIKMLHGNTTPLSIFPAMAISCAVEMGLARMPKADMPWIIYDQNISEKQFLKALEIGVDNE